MAPASTFTPKASLTEAPTNLKEAIDWVLRVTGRDGKELNKDTECICGLAAAVTDLLQSVQLEYHGYEGEANGNGPQKERVTECLNGLFSLIQGLGGTAVVRTYIDQLAQVLSALVGWSKIVQCDKGGDKGTCKKGNKEHHGQGGSGCKYLEDIEPENKCKDCGCMKYVVIPSVDWVQLGRGCTRCSDEAKKACGCTPGGSDCSPGKECQCALAGRCCKCCCTGCSGKCKKDAKCSCVEEDKDKANDMNIRCRRIYNDSYQSAYSETVLKSFLDEANTAYRQPKWNDLIYLPDSVTPSQRRHQCAQILLGSVCLIWSGITYMHWTGKWTKGSPYWNNHILDGSGLDDGTLSQWLQALGFPKEMLNNHGPKNRLDQVIWNGFRDMLFLGFLEPSGLGDGVSDTNGNTARSPFGMNYAGFIHTIHRDSFNTDQATVFPNGTSSSSAGQISETNQHKNGALFKLYILSCAYFTGLQKKTTTESTPRTPRTIREILYWLSALPYSQGYKGLLQHCNSALEKASPTEKKLSFLQQGRSAPITVDEFNLFAHFQAVTQYCPLVLIGIQGGLHSTDTTTPAIHALYANTECSFTYPTVSIQAYNQVVHYIRALFYQLYFLRKQCAVKVALGGKWRECRYGSGVVSNGVISWMCLGCDPMEHDRKCRVENMGKMLDGVMKKVKAEEEDGGSENELTKQEDVLAKKLKVLLDNIGQVVVQLGNAQEALEGKEKEAINAVKTALGKAKQGLETAKGELGKVTEIEFAESLGDEKLKELMGEDGNGGLLGELTKSGSGALDTLANGNNAGSLQQVSSEEEKWKKDYSSAKDRISEVINQVREALDALREWLKKQDDELNGYQGALLKATEQLLSICNSPKCPPCNDHINKCGRQGEKKTCPTCHQQYMDGFPSPLQAFLEDRLPGFSCKEVPEDENPVYPFAASHLGHCGGSGQCCPLPMGFRGQFQKDGIRDCTGKRLYGILYFFSNENMMQSCVYTLVRVTAALSATTPQVLGDVFGFFRGGVGNPVQKEGDDRKSCGHTEDPKTSTGNDKYFCGWCASGLRDEVKKIEWIPFDTKPGGQYMDKVGKALVNIKGDKGSGITTYSSTATANTSLSRLTKNCQYLSPLTGELYTAVSATFGGTYLSWVLYLSDALHSGLESLASEFQQIECRGCKGNCDPNKCRKGSHGATGNSQCNCSSIVSCTGVLPVLYRHGFSYGNPFNLEGYEQKEKEKGDYSISDKDEKTVKHCHEFLDSLKKVIESTEKDKQKDTKEHPLTNLLSQVGKLQYDIRLPWIFVLTIAWLVAVLYLAFGAIWPLDWTHMRSHWLRGGEHQWQCMWYKVMTGRKGMELVEYFGRKERNIV